METLTFDLAGHCRAVPLELVREIVREVRVTPLPSAPPGVEGVINLRGQVVPVLALEGGRPTTGTDHFIVVQSAERLVALRVTRAREILSVSDDLLEPAESDTLLGVSPLPDGLLVVHDPERLLKPGELERLDAALAARRAGESS